MGHTSPASPANPATPENQASPASDAIEARRASNAREPFPGPPSLWSALATLTGHDWPLISDAHVAAFVAAAEHHRLLPIAAEDPTLPARIRVPAALRYDAIAAADASADRAAAELIALVAEVLPCDWLCVNGADFRTRVYPASRLRPMNDVDILVRRADLPTIMQALLEHGFTRKPYPLGILDIGLLPPNAGAQPAIWLDLYERFADHTRVDIDYEEIWAARERGTDGLPHMAAHHALAVHTLLIANMQFVTHLRKLLDLWLLSREAACVRRAIDCAQRWNMRRSLYASLMAMRRLFPEVAADPWNADLDTLLTRQERAPLDRLLDRGPLFATMPSRPVQIWRKLQLLDSTRHRAGFLAGHAAAMARRIVHRPTS